MKVIPIAWGLLTLVPSAGISGGAWQRGAKQVKMFLM